jgi:hypothetical protein
MQDSMYMVRYEELVFVNIADASRIYLLIEPTAQEERLDSGGDPMGKKCPVK